LEAPSAHASSITLVTAHNSVLVTSIAPLPQRDPSGPLAEVGDASSPDLENMVAQKMAGFALAAAADKDEQGNDAPVHVVA
jgi:hypothetical protein